MSVDSASKFSPLLRWMGITLVVMLLLQMLGVLIIGQWQEESFRQLLVERLIAQAPMALVGLMLMYFSARLDDQREERSPLLWAVCILSGILAISLTAALPVSLSGDQMLQQQSERQLAQQRTRLETARLQSKNPAFLQQVIQQFQASGQVPPGVTEAQKTQAARAFLDKQLDQLQDQAKQAEQSNLITLNQRRFGGSGGAVVLIVAFTILCLGSVL
ncbi:MAG: HpsJ family protein [Synechococcaceae cyanobacterium]